MRTPGGREGVDAERSGPALVILGGSDRRPGPVPRGVEGLHFTVGYKGVSILLEGRPLVSHLVEHAREADVFDTVSIAGPPVTFRPFTDAEIIATDGSLACNLEAVTETFLARYGPQGTLAVITCDVLPTADDLRHLALRYEAAGRPAFWFALVRIADEAAIGASHWKSRYWIRPTRTADPIPLLPGHLVICRPSQLRTRFIFKLFHLAYQVRNQELEARKRRLLPRIVAALLQRDLANLLQGQWPTLTYTVTRHGLATFFKLKRGGLDLPTLEWTLSLVLLRRRFRTRRGSVRVEITDRISIAKDFDTVEEIEEGGGTWHGGVWSPRRRRRRGARL